ncbi:MAG: GGDEF domain-containing protein [Gammaproteobacteria bacterium]|nr:GGDEF domain-containing protein [Gammaproteobacteria bacterium]
MSVFIESTETKLSSRSYINASYGTLFLLTVIVSSANFLLYLPLKAGLGQAVNFSAILIALLFWGIAYKYPAPLISRITSSLAFLVLFSAWSYLDLYNATLSDMINIIGLMILLIWHNLQYRQAYWISILVALVSLVSLKMLADLNIKNLIVYFLIYGFAISMGEFIRFFKLDVQFKKNHRDMLPNDETSRQGIMTEPAEITTEFVSVTEQGAPIINMTTHNSSYDWERTLRELHGELKSIHDVDSLFKSMLLFMSGAVEFDAAAVGMMQGKSIKKIASYGPDEFLHQKTLSWDSQRLNQLFKTRKEHISQQNHLNDKNNAEDLFRLDIPVFSSDKPVGLVSLFRHELLFDEYDCKLASGIVFHSMIALRQARLQEEIKRLSMSSSSNKTLLTREQFIERARVELDQLNKPRVFSLLIIEIDKYDVIEAQHGHQVATNLFKQTSVIILANLQADDEYGRYGKEGFIVLLHENDLLQAKKIAEQMRKQIAALKCKTKDAVVTTTVSIGLTTVSEQGEDMASLIRKADMGLFVAKESGFNTVKVSL